MNTRFDPEAKLISPKYIGPAATQAFIFDISYNRFVYPGGGDCDGLFTHADITDAIVPLQEQIPAWIDAAQRDLAGPMPDIAVGPQCNDPFACEFIGFCAPDTSEYPIAILPYGGKLARRLVDDGYAGDGEAGGVFWRGGFRNSCKALLLRQCLLTAERGEYRCLHLS
jgi:hypothetical protein